MGKGIKPSISFYLPLLKLYWALPGSLFYLFENIQSKVGVEVLIMSIGLKNVAIFGCVINLFHKGKSPP